MPSSPPQGYNVFFDIIQQIQDEGIDLPFQDTINFVGAGVTATDDAGNGRTNVTIPGQVPHDLLDANINQDTVAQTPSQGSLILANGTPLWDELLIGPNGTVLTSDGTTASWQSLPVDTDFYQTIQDEGIALAQQPTFNFTGAGVTATNDAGNNRTNIDIPGGAGLWEDLADVTAPGGTTTLTANFSARKNIRVYGYFHEDGAGDINMIMRINGDSGVEYSYDRQQNGGAWTSTVNGTEIQCDPGSIGHHEINIFDITDVDGHDKLYVQQMSGSDDINDPSTSAETQQIRGQYTDETARITSIEFISTANAFSDESYIRVIGFD